MTWFKCGWLPARVCNHADRSFRVVGDEDTTIRRRDAIAALVALNAYRQQRYALQRRAVADIDLIRAGEHDEEAIRDRVERKRVRRGRERDTFDNRS